MTLSSGKFRFRRHDNVGANDADDDEKFLQSCFEDTGDVKVLLDCSNPKRIVVGRTGAGKTALISEIAKRRSAASIVVNPQDLAFNYLTTSTVLRHLDSLGVNLDPFFKLLWRHVFAVAMIQRRFPDESSDETTLLNRLRLWFEPTNAKAKRTMHEERRKKALAYLEDWGGKFFKGYDELAIEVTRRFETRVSDSVKSGIGVDLRAGTDPSPELGLGVSAGHAIESDEGVEKRSQIVHYVKEVVNSIQVQELSGIVELLEEVLDDQHQLYALVDKLDEQWVDEGVRFRLLKGLLDTSREFGKVHNAKIVLCLRLDLLDRIFEMTRLESGFQEDKYRSLVLSLRWDRAQLIRLLDRRVAHLIKDTYTSYLPTIDDILPQDIDDAGVSVRAIDYILDRTWLRPRDAIEFLNLCIEKSEGQASISEDALLQAERSYSSSRLRAVSQEWGADYPDLEATVRMLLHGGPSKFTVSNLGNGKFTDWAIKCESVSSHCGLRLIGHQLFVGLISELEAKLRIASVFYRIGLVGIDPNLDGQALWSSTHESVIPPESISPEAAAFVHPGLWSELKVVVSRSDAI